MTGGGVPGRPLLHTGGVTRDEARAAVADASRRLAEEGLLIGTAGNVSMRLGGPEEGLVAVTATGVVLADCTPGDVTIVDGSGLVVDGDLAPTSELGLHLRLLARPDVGAVVHTHSPMATALSLVVDEIPVVHYQQLALGGPVPVVPFAVFGSDQLAGSVDAALQHRRAALMANHGAVAVGQDLGTAVDAMLLLEWICGIYWHACAIGRPRELTEAEQQAVSDVIRRTGYGTPRSADGPDRT